MRKGECIFPIVHVGIFSLFLKGAWPFYWNLHDLDRLEKGISLMTSVDFFSLSQMKTWSCFWYLHDLDRREGRMSIFH